MSFLMEQAGGIATTGAQRMLDVQPEVSGVGDGGGVVRRVVDGCTV